MKDEGSLHHRGATVEQVAEATSALGLYTGRTPRRSTRRGLPDAVELDDDARHTAWEEQLTATGAGLLDDPLARVEFIRWQVLRAGTPLRLMAQNPATGPIPPAAVHAPTGLHMLLGVIAVALGDVDTPAAQAGQHQAAREALSVRLTMQPGLFRPLAHAHRARAEDAVQLDHHRAGLRLCCGLLAGAQGCSCRPCPQGSWRQLWSRRGRCAARKTPP